MMGRTLLEVRDLCKEYPGTVALDNVSCRFEQGKIHALLGKNGSGKSTFCNIVAGITQASHGKVVFKSKEVSFSSPAEAISNGVTVVHQEMSLIPHLTVAENIYLGRLETKGLLKKIDWKTIFSNSKLILDDLGVSNIRPEALVASLSIGQQQQIEIAKAVSEKPELLILDEPTSALALKEVDTLFEIMRNLVKKGVTMIYISHRLQELSQIADTVSILRDGKFINAMPMEEATHDKILHMLFGEISVFERGILEDHSYKKTVLSVAELTREPFFRNVSFDLYQGEILGIAGLMGAGRTEILRSIFGLDVFTSGKITVNGEPLKKKDINPVKMKKRGISYVSENRKEEGLVLVLSSHFNLILASMKDIISKNKFYINKKMENGYVAKQIQALSVKLADSEYPVTTLSGGNQQKIVVGNWLNTNPQIMFFDEPSRGIDVEAKQQIFQIMWEQKEKGVSTLMVSSELEELQEVCDRILILRNGRIAEVLLPSQVTVNELYKKCMVI